MEGCIFCQIVEGKMKGYIVYQDHETAALLDIFPSVSGHVMVIPKKHGGNVLEFSEKELGKVFATVKKTIKALEKAFNTEVFTIGINHGEKLGVPHLHIHVLPRYEGDKGGIIQTVVKNRVKDNLQETAEKIKKNF